MLSATLQKTPPQLIAAEATFGKNAWFAGIAVISGVVNILMLTAPLFMLQVYDRVLASRSLPTLVGLGILAVALYAFQAVLEIIRTRVLLRIGERFDHRFSDRVHGAILRTPLATRNAGDGLQPLRDLENIRSFLAGQGPTAFFDIPWMPLYLAICFVFHVWIGVAALAGAIVLVAITLLTHRLTSKPTRDIIEHSMARNALMESARRNAEVIRAMGLERRMAVRWQRANVAYLTAGREAGDVAGDLGGISRSLRVMLQSLILALGAWLVIRQEASPGVMIAASIMMGRALAPVDQAIAHWRSFLMARQSWSRLRDLVARFPVERPVTALPAPKSDIRAESISAVPPGGRKPTVHGISFAIAAGSALGIVGPSGSGKTTLARVIVGAWQPAHGKIRIDGASLDQWDREALGRHVGYLPQGVELFDGTIAENIARFDPQADSAEIVCAAKAADAHDLILRFEHGYETRIGEAGSTLSAGQRQRIGLARALFRDPFLVVLDEPNANLDAEGEAALVKAIAAVRVRNGIAIVVAHRPSAIGAVDLLLMMEDGRTRAFGPRDEVLSRTSKAKPDSNTTASSQGGYRVTGRSLNSLRVIADPAASTRSGSVKIAAAEPLSDQTSGEMVDGGEDRCADDSHAATAGLRK